MCARGVEVDVIPGPGDFRGQFSEADHLRAQAGRASGPIALVPRAVASPRTVQDVSTLVIWACDNGVTIVPRGAGTGMPGGNVGPGVSLDLYLTDHLEPSRRSGDSFDEVSTRRLAVAYLLHYLAYSSPTSLAKAVGTIDAFKGEMGRDENRYWYHYIQAHRAMDKGDPSEFVEHTLDLWLNVVVPMETLSTAGWASSV